MIVNFQYIAKWDYELIITGFAKVDLEKHTLSVTFTEEKSEEHQKLKETFPIVYDLFEKICNGKYDNSIIQNKYGYIVCNGANFKEYIKDIPPLSKKIYEELLKE